MKRWGTALFVAVLSCIPVLLRHATSPALLADSDTTFLLKVIREKRAPMSWFTSDWPLGNHFYRPISTLPFELDNRLYGDSAAGYGWTNCLLCVACILLVAWLWREVTDSVALTCGGTALFALWHWNGLGRISPWIALLAQAFVAVSFFWRLLRRYVPSLAVGRPKVNLWRDMEWGRWLPACGALYFLSGALDGIVGLQFRMIDWIPGRTASVMTVFCLISMAAYARYERTSARFDPARATATDEPATKSSVQDAGPSRANWAWPILATLSGALALASYEQAVMLPTALLGIAVSFRIRRFRVRWGWQVGFWSLLVAYWLVRHAYVPSDVSGYQAQQFRSGPGVYFSLLAYLFPAASSIYLFFKSLDLGWTLLITDRLYGAVWFAYSNLASLQAALRHWQLALTGFALSFFAYLPMAWLNQFDHYHYWPMALRSLYVSCLAWGVWELCVIAVSPPARQAPERLAPAPGSLPHP